MKNDFESLAWCSLSLGALCDRLRPPRYEKIKLNGSLSNAYLHVYHCYGETMNAKRLLPIMIDSEQTCRNHIQDAAQ